MARWHYWLTISGLALLLGYGGYVGWRLLPESSPFSRISRDPPEQACLACHTQPFLLTDVQLRGCRRSDEPRPSHPTYQGDCDDLLAYFEIVTMRDHPPMYAYPSGHLLRDGEYLARQFYCFQCHGELGQGNEPNLGALKGYIPGYYGQDFRDLTDDADASSIARWIHQGVDPDILSRPLEGVLAHYFLQRQSIQMPHFDSLSTAEMRVLVCYLQTLNQWGALDAKTARQLHQRRLAPDDQGISACKGGRD